MIQSSDYQRKTLLEIVTGERPIADASALGLFITETAEGKKLVGDLPGVVISPAIDDVVSGFLRNRNSPDDLRNWAFLMLAEIGAIDLSDLEEASVGETLFQALWDASESGTVSDELIGRVSRLQKS